MYEIAKDIDVEDALKEIKGKSELWELNTMRQDYPGSAHKNTQSIILRGPKTYTEEAIFNDLEAFWDTSILIKIPKLDKLLSKTLGKYFSEWKIGRVMIVKLNPVGYITKHRDEGAYAAYYDRFHLVMSSEPGNVIRSWPEENHMRIMEFAPGTLFQFPHRLPHEVFNYSRKPRIHIIIDARKE